MTGARQAVWMVRVALAACAGLGGCAGSHAPSFRVEPGQYARAFDASRDVLREYRFTLERVDAAAGVITTRPKATAGLATPWDSEQSTLGQEFEDLVNDQKRRVRISFEPADKAAAKPGAAGESLGASDGALIARVDVGVYRIENPGLRLPPGAISQASLTTDPALKQRWVTYGMETPVARDSRLASRLAAAIERHIAAGAARPAAREKASEN